MGLISDGDGRSPAPLRGVALFTGAYLMVSVVFAGSRGNSEFLFYIGVMVVLIGAIAGLHRRVGLTRGTLWALSVWGLLHMVGGLVPVPESWPIGGPVRVVYSLWLVPEVIKYDHLVHAYGFGVTTWVCWQGMRSAAAGFGGDLQPTFGVLVLCAAAGIGLGALNEVIEFAAVLTVPETNVGGYENTGWDLVANTVGACIAAVAIRVAWSRRSAAEAGAGSRSDG